jgi:magnesium-transporting ATPase (P-type)
MGIFHLKNENIFCFEKSKLISPSRINTIFFSKTGILCENNFEINGYHPIYINPHRANSISYRTYKENQYKEMNSQLLKYYKGYLEKRRNDPFNHDTNLRHALRVERNQLFMDKMSKESCECTTIFLECLLSCNNIEKYNTEIFGNSIEIDIFKNMNWDIKSYRFNNNNISDKSDGSSYSNSFSYLSQSIGENKKYYYDEKFNLIDKNINDIYPNNYYKITESIKNESQIQLKPVITRLNTKFYLEQMKKKGSINSNISEFSVTPNSSNFIKKNISESHIVSYKLRIYKRFIKNGTLTTSAIVYNFITKELRFMTKGIPEEVLDKCDKTTIPENFDNVISIYRRQGFILVICACKIIDIDEYKDSNSIDVYMNNLTFCGFVTLKNKLKMEIINSIRDLRQFNCNLIISSGDNIFNCLPIGFDSSIIENKNIFSFDKEEKKNRIMISKIYSNKKVNDLEEEIDKKTSTSFDKLSKQTITNKIPSSPFTKPKETVMIKLLGNNSYSRVRKETAKNSDDISRRQTDDDNEEKETNTENRRLTPIKNMKGKGIHKKIVDSKSPLENKKTRDKEMLIQRNQYHSNIRNTYKEISRTSNMTPLNLAKNRYKTDNKDGTESNTNRKFIEIKNNKTITNFEKLSYYPGIFEENEDLTNNCIYCISGRAFSFLYKNKERKQYKLLLEKIHKYCKIFYNMSSLDKSLAIDYYREYPDSCVCTIGKYQNDYDALMTSNVGINLSPPKNQNTILCHFYSGDSNILSIKKIIREGRTINENILLLKITSFFYTLILNSYILCCFMMEIEVINGQLNLLELCFLFLSVTAFTVQYDTSTNSNPLIQNRKLYIYHYTAQIFGVVFLKISSVYMLREFYIDNDLLPKRNVYKIFITYYFILCIEQCFSTFFVLNYISFYRKHPLSNITFISFNLVLFIYFIILITLNSSNYRCDLFGITDFEFNEDLIDSFDDKNRLKCFRVCIFDFSVSFIYSRIVYLIFDKLAKKNS